MECALEKFVKLLAPIFQCRCCLNKTCEICFRAKHSRDKFIISDTSISRIFEKVTCDLWGPYKHTFFLLFLDLFVG